jgi:hypothetical protein
MVGCTAVDRFTCAAGVCQLAACASSQCTGFTHGCGTSGNAVQLYAADDRIGSTRRTAGRWDIPASIWRLGLNGNARRGGVVFLFLLATVLGGCAVAGPVPQAASGKATPAAPGVQMTLVRKPTATVRPAHPPQAPILQEHRLLSWEWPAVIRVGDSDRVRLTLEMDQAGKVTPTAEVSGNPIGGQPVYVPDLYDTHNIVAEARLDLAGMVISPEGTIDEPLTRGQTITFYWSIRPSEAGNYEGTLWFFLNLVPKKGGDTIRQPIMAQRVNIEAQSIFGLSGNTVRIAGAAGSVVSAVLGFPFLENILALVWRRLQRKKLRPQS